MSRIIDCVYLGEQAEGLDEPPIAGDLGQEVFDKISKQAWESWQEREAKLLADFNLDLSQPAAQEFIEKEIREFLFGGMGVDVFAATVKIDPN